MATILGNMIAADLEVLNPAQAYGTLRLNASGNKVAMVFRVMTSGTITAVSVRCATHVTTANSTFGLYTVDSSGIYTTTAYGGMSAVTVSVNGTGTFTGTFATPATAVAGDLVAFVIEMTGVGDYRFAVNNYSLNMGFPYTIHNGTKTGSHLIMALSYDTGYANIPGILPAYTGTTAAINTGTATKELGNIFTAPVTAKVYGAIVWVSVVAGADFDVILYSSDGTALATTSIVAGKLATAGTMGSVSIIFSSVITLTAGASYYLMVKPTTANSVTLRTNTFLNANSLASTTAGVNTMRADKTVGFATTSTERVLVTPVFSEIGISTGSGGGGGSELGPSYELGNFPKRTPFGSGPFN